MTFTVADAADPVSSAHVKVGTRTCTTGSAGKCSITFPKLPGQTLTAVATRSGYVKDTQKLTILD